MARSRYRSVSYDLDAAVEVARIVEQAGGSAGADIVAPALGYSGTNNGTWLTRLANARLFGVVGGQSRRLELTGRGRGILSGGPEQASAARREAVLAVPLFRAVLENAEAAGGELPDASALAGVLEQDFGEQRAKSATVAAKLLSSAVQGGLIARRVDGSYQFTALLTRFTAVDDGPSRRILPGVGLLVRPGSWSRRAGRGYDVDDGLFLDEAPHPGSSGPVRGSGWRRAGTIAAVAALVALVAVPVGLVALGGNPAAKTAQPHPPKSGHLGHGPAEHQVLTALSATTDSGNFNVAYRLSATPGTPPPTTTTTTCPEETVIVPTGPSTASGLQGVAGGVRPYPATTSSAPIIANGPTTVTPGSLPPGTKSIQERMCSGGTAAPTDTVVAGTGTIDTSPMAMVVSAQLGTPGSPSSGLQVSVRVDSSSVYEDLSALDTSLAPPASEANTAGQPISGFASITESTLGAREGAIAMMGLASPTGYLELDQQSITGAAQSGTGTVDGVPVTTYQVTEDPSLLENTPGLSPEESKTIAAAVGVLNAEGSTGTTDQVSVDGSGFIRESSSTTTFSDGGSVVIDATFSNFGCAGIVLMPGQQGATAPPTGCTSPDTGTAPTTTTTNPAKSPSADLTPTTTPPANSTTTAPTTGSTTIPSTVPGPAGSTTTTSTTSAVGSGTTTSTTTASSG